MLKLFAAAGAAGALTPALAACTSSSAATARSTQTLRVGLIYPQLGPLQDVGFEISNGFQLFVNNNGNRIGGMNAEVVKIDEGTSAASGKDAVNHALKSGSFDVIVGIANSEVMAAIPDAATAARVPVLGTLGSPANMRSSDFVWRTSFVNGEASKALGIYLSSAAAPMGSSGSLGRPKSIVVYTDGSADGVAESTAFLNQIAATNIEVHPVTGAAASVMGQIKGYQADLVYAATSGDNAAAFIKLYRGGPTARAPLCGPGALTELGTDIGGARSVFTSMNYATDISNDANQQFSSSYFTANSGKVASTYAMTSYDAGMVLDSAINLIDGDVTPLRINQALGSAGVFDSPRGRWQFNQSRTPLQQWYLRQVRADGKFLENMVLTDLATMS